MIPESKTTNVVSCADSPLGENTPPAKGSDFFDKNRQAPVNQFQLDNPALESMGVRITDWRKDYVELDLQITSNMLNRSGVVHGGAVCALLDAATGYSGLYSPPEEELLHAVTLSLTSNFLANGVGKRLSAIGFVERRGRSIYFSRAEVWLDDETLVATGVATMKYLASPRRPQKDIDASR